MLPKEEQTKAFFEALEFVIGHLKRLLEIDFITSGLPGKSRREHEKKGQILVL